MSSTPPPITLRAPSSTASPSTTTIPPPALSWLEGTWNVTHSTLPMWKKNHNVQITYKRVPGTSPAHIDDVVTYQPIGSENVKMVRGVDKPFAVPGADVQEGDDVASLGYNWRGSGWLMIASSKWEILGYGEEELEGGEKNQWAVTHFAKTLFTPEGLDIYSRRGQLKEETVREIQKALADLGESVAKLAVYIFVVSDKGGKSTVSM